MRSQTLRFSVALVALSVGQALADAPQSKPIRAVLFIGGFAHDFDAFASVTAAFLPEQVTIELEVVRDGSFLDSPASGDLDVIIMNHCFESTAGVLTEPQKQRLFSLVRRGIGVVAIHASYYSFRDWPQVRDLYGADFTQHGSSDVVIEVRMEDRRHPITEGLAPTFRVRSELYQSTPLANDCHVLAYAKEVGTEQEYPSVWVRPFGRGRVVTILPAHWPEAYQEPEFQKLIAASVRWADRDS